LLLAFGRCGYASLLPWARGCPFGRGAIAVSPLPVGVAPFGRGARAGARNKNY